MRELNEQIKNRLEICKRITANMKEYQDLSSELLNFDNMDKFNGIDMRLISIIVEEYEYGNLIFNDGEVYCIQETLLDDVDIVHTKFIARRVKWNLELSTELYDIEKLSITEDDSVCKYTVKERC